MRSAEAFVSAGSAAWARAQPRLAPLYRAAGWLYARPLVVLAGLAGAHWACVLAFALTVRHNGWVYYQGGDQIWYTTSASLIGDGVLPPTFIGFGWVLPLVPFSWVVGPEYTAFLPILIAVNVLVLAPVALACVYGIATRIGGRLLGLYAAALWVAAPYLAIPFFRFDYHGRYVEQFLPHALGLNGLADYPSLVCLLLAAYLLVRALEGADWTWAVPAGLAAAVAATIKPSNLLFFAGPALMLLLARRWRLVVPYAAATVPSLLLLALWKWRGLGELPVLAVEQTRVAAGSVLSSTAVDRYLNIDWDTFRQNMAGLREWTYSVRVLQWIPLAGAFAVARRSPPLAGLLAGWFGAFLLVKGTTPLSTVESGSFWRFLMPAFPAYFLLFVAIPLLIPGLLRRTKALAAAEAPRPVGRRTFVVLGVLFVAIPLAAILAPRPLAADAPEAVSIGSILTPVDDEIRVTVTPDGERRTVTWAHPDFGPTDVFYRVYRTDLQGHDVECSTHRSPQCLLTMVLLTTTREARYVDGSPPPDARYRIGIGTNWENNAEGGDVVSISRPIPATP
jgi:hypothetical protein